MKRTWQQSFLYAVCALVLFFAFVWGYVRSKTDFFYYGSIYTKPQPNYAFVGTTGKNEIFNFPEDAFGKTTLIFFGFTNCPDICPLTLKYLRELRDTLTEEQNKKLLTLFISIDPQRDTVEKLQEYVDFFGKDTSIALLIKEPKLRELANAYGVIYEKVPAPPPLNYQVNHTTAVYVVDKTSNIKILWDYTQLSDINRIRNDLLHIIGEK